MEGKGDLDGPAAGVGVGDCAGEAATDPTDTLKPCPSFVKVDRRDLLEDPLACTLTGADGGDFSCDGVGGGLDEAVTTNCRPLAVVADKGRDSLPLLDLAAELVTLLKAAGLGALAGASLLKRFD